MPKTASEILMDTLRDLVSHNESTLESASISAPSMELYYEGKVDAYKRCLEMIETMESMS